MRMKMKRTISVVVVTVFLFYILLYYRILPETKSDDVSPVEETNIHGEPQIELLQPVVEEKKLYYDSISLNGDFDWYRYFVAEKDANCIDTISTFRSESDDKPPITIPSSQTMSLLSENAVRCLYHRYLTTLQTLCTLPTKFGNWTIGGGNVCEDDGPKPGKNCLVYIFSDVVNYFYFGLNISNTYGCKTYIYGPSSEAKASRHNMTITDTRLGTGHRFTWILKQMNHEKTRIDVLSLDVQKEWDILHHMLLSGSLDHVEQLLINAYGTKDNSTKLDYTLRLTVLQALYEAGFRIFWFDRDLSCRYEQNKKYTGCYRISLMRTKSISQPLSLPDKNAISEMNPTYRGDLFHKYINSLQVHCKDIVRMGRLPDGGWEMCNDDQYRPRNPCLVYSFGINNDYSFDDDVAVTFNCEVHSFDPSDGKTAYRHAPMVWFHDIGISNYDGELKVDKQTWSVKTLGTIMKDLGHARRHLEILKIDVEKSEWDALPDIIASKLLDNVTQLLFEIHIGKIQDEDDNFKKYLYLFKVIYDNGFRIFFHRKGGCYYNSKSSGKLRTACHEIFTIKVKNS